MSEFHRDHPHIISSGLRIVEIFPVFYGSGQVPICVAVRFVGFIENVVDEETEINFLQKVRSPYIT
jgi:hypothetical protein